MLESILWYLVSTFIGLLALPVVRRLLPFLSDRGYTAARALGILLWGFAFWLLTSLRILQNDLGGVLIALAILAGLSLWASRGREGWHEMVAWMKSHPRLVIMAESVFLASFIFMLCMRAAYPSIAGTEKPMEMAFINAILRSPSFPPADPWLSGYAISYYYFGYVIVSMLIRLTGAAPAIAFNLAIALVFGLAAVGSYGIVYSLLARWSQHRQAEGRKGIFSQGWALLAPLIILLAGNLEGSLEVLHANGTFWQQSGQAKTSQFWSWLGILELNEAPAEPYSLTPKRPGGIWWWRASRVIQDYNMSAEVRQALPGLPITSYITAGSKGGGPIEVIDEFPFFSFFLADLHPHVLAIPFGLLAVAMALNLYLRGASDSFRDLTVWRWLRQIEFWLAAVVLGGLAFLNIWNFPIYVALFSASYTLVRYQQMGWKWWPRIRDFVGLAATLGFFGVIFYLPFYIGFASQAGGILPSLAFFSRGLHFWIMFGSLLVPIIFWMLWLARQQGKRHHFGTGLRFSLMVIGTLWVGSYLLGILGLNLSSLGQLASGNNVGSSSNGLASNLVYWGSLFLGLQGGSDASQAFWGSILRRLELPGTWLTLLFLLAGIWALLASLRPGPEVKGESEVQEEESEAPASNPSLGNPQGFVLLLALLGTALTLTPEFFYLRDQFGGRMNTIFKFYFEAWMLWGLAAAFASALIWKELRGILGWLARLVWSLVLLAAMAYPLFAISERFDVQFVSDWTLDGTAQIQKYDPDEKAAIDWLAQAPYGVIAEAVGGSYTSAARMATFSGLPNVLGWPGHESQWRGGGAEMGSRQDDLSQLYRTRDWTVAQSILQRYQIRYVVVGNLERSTYRADDPNGQRGLDESKFQKNLKPAFVSNSVTIYEVSVSLSSVEKEK